MEGMKRARQLVSGHIHDMLVKCCDDLVTEAPDLAKGFRNFTGNTITGYAAGLYMDGALSDISLSVDGQKKPVHVKVRKGETVHLAPDYDGRERSFTGTVETDGGYSSQTAVKFLMGYKSKARSGFEIVVTNGTEYASYLENARNADVLTGLFRNASQILAQNIKPIK